MNTKKFLGLALASTLALSMTAPAFAAPGADTPTTPEAPVSEPNKLSFDYSGETWTQDDVVINVSMPTATSGSIILNPYELNYVDESSGTPTAAHNKVIVGGYNYVENNSSFEVDVAWEVTGTTTGGAVLATKAPTSTSTTKDVYLPIKLNGAKTKAAADLPATNVATTLKCVTADTQTSDDKTKVVLDKAGATNHLGVASTDPTPFLCFGIDGSAAAINTGKNLAEDWTAEDGVSVSMVFTFSKHMAS